ncbi:MULTISPECIES: phospho-N-acetylmuramoyl-pentapeptide-transferase [Thermoactinomyces]|jgi:phospho-N-acetylmuramoyl-pentapeptide-transferase|uniref:Phospho-N-acetylmuramoyl-pentapeptide-transferase n=2 Tax=Thermoactinomyces TaxID=2023 RepID=A0A8I1A2B3_THEIN|nr:MULTISPECIES: phospho-N-acetylmuramoyl-pentapeptide-transferase [Thermoactinomyces]KFZ40649.1 phospho-N-acetylmuramoyl-pentapeptide-transferase [Thermoactinomyces sp. Gus2-1]KYQ86953.1 phospho-N-acetylmuramoyl-pentapeptide-transferase [Thermoactinomyces sp. AS95]MBA4547559.1 phospho-N-acetylmuramoyl-pentapeptide-transferase [Thermoactinomyces intermedius]MBA4551676.1 phospho-N-acetylmuramoyl-pentapeptide-transferase [Thermoactinomyces vulgaris]MBA4596445.1 phospho-N-acetylmuramoyl-pentapept
MGNLEFRFILIPLAVAFGIAVILGPMIIPVLKRLKFGQSIREEGPQAHLKKAGTPTMGGVIILTAIVLTAVPLSSLTLLNNNDAIINADLFFLVFATLGYGILGFLDDYIKVVMKRNLGLTANQKLLGQLFIGLVLFWVLLEVRTGGPNNYIFSLDIPFTDLTIHLNWLYLPLLLLMMIGASNAVNLTDGLDGLLAGTAVSAYGAYAVIGILQSNPTVTIFSVAVVGALLGFLVFNANPAKVFMGDTGSLALGGGIAALAVITKTELLLPIIGGIFVIETLSVMIQVTSFKFRGKRVFRMSPLHHHFELCGWSEWRVVTTFWFFGLVLAGLGVFLEMWL